LAVRRFASNIVVAPKWPIYRFFDASDDAHCLHETFPKNSQNLPSSALPIVETEEWCEYQ
jgi:hypothetical protein